MQKSILVTGGAGYIGSHVVKQLGEKGEHLVVLDNLSTGFRESVLYGEFIEGDSGDMELVTRILHDHSVDAILHFSAHTIVPESVSNPLKYYSNNTCKTRNLLRCASNAGIKHIIFSSTASVYGIPGGPYCYESSPVMPVNPYGTSKLVSEWMLRDVSAVSGLRYVVLRYFNVAGSDPEGKIGQSTQNATLLIKVAVEVAVGKREKLFIFGTDYPTPDGTGIRDYVHVSDLADAHVRALEYLRKGGESIVLNCGYGHGYSVREVVHAIHRVQGVPIAIEECPRRPGDPPQLIAAVENIHRVLEWNPRYDDLDFIIETSLAWEKKLETYFRGYNTNRIHHRNRFIE